MKLAGATFAASLVVFGLRAPVSGSTPSCAPEFIRGDASSDGSIDLSDALRMLQGLFISHDVILCEDAADVNDDGALNISDPVFVLGYLFLGTGVPPFPGITCGADPSDDFLGCESYDACVVAYPPEICDGFDNDCDGKIDEGFDLLRSVDNCGSCGSSCFDKGWPHVVDYDCQFGVCFIRLCEEHWRDLDGIGETGCEAFFPPDGMPCDDGKPCTADDRYFSGVCGGTPKDCSDLDEPCRRGVCDVATGECIAKPRQEGTPCGEDITSRRRCDEFGECVEPPIP